MSELVVSTSPVALPQVLPPPRVPITIRPGTLADIPFMDSLQKLHTRQVGWMPTKQFEGKIKLGHVLIAEERDEEMKRPRDEVEGAHSVSSSLGLSVSRPVGYLIGNDQYFKRDDLGIIYQLNVAPGKQRGFIGASLLKAQFEQSAYGCKLYCCWCAQDIEANKFWEAMGFVPLAFRAGSEKRGKNGGARVHIFWQRRIRRGDTTTQWWFPSKTDGGAIREDRIVLPIPPGMRWDDVLPVLMLEEAAGVHGAGETPALPGHCGGPKRVGPKTARAKAGVMKPGQMPQTMRMPVRFGKPNMVSPAVSTAGPTAGPTAVQPMAQTVAPTGAIPVAQAVGAEKPVKPRRIKKANPALAAAARELRDRWLEKVNDFAPALPGGKYEVSRNTPARLAAEPVRLLAA